MQIDGSTTPSDAATPLTAESLATSEISSLVDDFSAFATACERTDLVGSACREYQRWATPFATVVVIGETKRGKTSVINALLDASGLLPCDVDVATSTFIEVRYSEVPVAAILQTQPDGSTVPVPIDLSELHRWTSDAHREPGSRDPASLGAVVGFPSSLLRTGLRIIDTPGVGGLNPEHARVAFSAIHRADSLFMVLDCTAPISQAELDFVARALQFRSSVCFIMTKVDLVPDWRKVLEVNRPVLQKVVPAGVQVRVFPVSSRFKELAGSAAMAAQQGAREALIARSGFAALEDELHNNVLAGVERLRRSNVLKVLDSSLSVLLKEQEIAVLTARKESVGGSQDLGQLQEVEQLRHLQRSALQTRVTEQMALIRTRIVRQLADSAHELLSQAETLLETDGKHLTDEELLDFVECSVAEIDLTIRIAMENAINALVSRVDQEFQLGIPPLEIERLVVEGLTLNRERAANSSSGIQDDSGFRTVQVAASSLVPGGIALSSFASGNIPITMVYGAGVVVTQVLGFLSVRRAKSNRRSQERRQMLRQTVQQLVQDGNVVIAEWHTRCQSVLRDHLAGAIQDRLQSLQASIERNKELTRSDAAHRQRVAMEADGLLRRGRGLRERILQLAEPLRVPDLVV